VALSEKDIDRDVWSAFRGEMSLGDLAETWTDGRPIEEKRENARHISEKIEEILLAKNLSR
jgi:hypothetical protein